MGGNKLNPGCNCCGNPDCPACEGDGDPIAVEVVLSGFPDTLLTGTYVYPDGACNALTTGSRYLCDESPTERTSDQFTRTFHSYEVYDLSAILNATFTYYGSLTVFGQEPFPDDCNMGDTEEHTVDAAKFTHDISATNTDLDGNTSYCASTSKTLCSAITATVTITWSFYLANVTIEINDPSYTGVKPTFSFTLTFADTFIDYCTEQTEMLAVDINDYYLQIGGPFPVSAVAYICGGSQRDFCRDIQNFTITAVKNALF